ncbi:MAG: sigma-70 family RNA polymerase sigma factor [Myxococcota bacterium]|nr:sigma-70 family RNA polymerase sigma factor [Myxococcota bacterium]
MEEVAGWLERAARGDEGAYRELYGAFAPPVRRLLGTFASLSAADAEDALQETFVRAFRSLSALKDPAGFSGWLMAIARNRALSRLDRSRSRQAAEAQLEAELSGQVVPAFPEALRLERDAQVVRELISELPEGPERRTVELFYLEGELSAREIAEQLGVGKSAVTMRLERFRTKVKRELLRRVLARRTE